jgi:hypothetical protein
MDLIVPTNKNSSKKQFENEKNSPKDVKVVGNKRVQKL